MSEAQSPQEVTRLIQAAGAPGPAAEQLLTLVYTQLRKIAQQRMREERAEHTLQATALVHEAYVRLLGETPIDWQGAGHFFAAAAEAMRRILIEHARGKARKKRGGDGSRPPKRVTKNVLDLVAADDPEEILMLDDAICRLESEDPQAARVVRLRFFAGLSVDETAAALGVAPSSVDREWVYARARLQRLLHE